MEMLERSRMRAALATFLLVMCIQSEGVWGRQNRTSMYYVCPPDFIMLGNSCFYISTNKATWQSAYFTCKGRDSTLLVPERWEDRNLREYLNKPEIQPADRWIGGIYNYGARAFMWGGEMRPMKYHSFSHMKKMTPEQLQWHCIAMIPEMLYRWAAKNCVQPRHYICKAPLLKVKKAERNKLKRKWKNIGKINEVAVLATPEEAASLPVKKQDNPKSYDIRPNELRQRSVGRHGGMRRRLKVPFPGYVVNRNDPEAAYRSNVKKLLSGSTGLTPSQVKENLRRLERKRKRQLARRKRKQRGNGDWLSNDIPKRSQMLKSARHETYTVENTISALHPKTIVEVHAFDDIPPPPPPVVQNKL